MNLDAEKIKYYFSGGMYDLKIPNEFNHTHEDFNMTKYTEYVFSYYLMFSARDISLVDISKCDSETILLISQFLESKIESKIEFKFDFQIYPKKSGLSLYLPCEQSRNKKKIKAYFSFNEFLEIFERVKKRVCSIYPF